MNKIRISDVMYFLMTYGWAILAAVIVIAVLASFSVMYGQPLSGLEIIKTEDKNSPLETIPDGLVCFNDKFCVDSIFVYYNRNNESERECFLNDIEVDCFVVSELIGNEVWIHHSGSRTDALDLIEFIEEDLK